MSKTTRLIVYGAVLTALSIVLIIFVHFPIFPAAPWLEYDMGDVPLFFGAVLLGPWYGLLVTLCACIIQGLTVSAGSGIIGIVMHFLATGSFVVCAGFITRKYKKKAIVPAFICGAVTQILVTIPLNLIFTPAFGLSENVFSAIGTYTLATLRIFVSFPGGILSVASGAVAAVAFVVAFLLTVIYTDCRKRDDRKKHRDSRGIEITPKSTALGIVFGFIYAALSLMVINLLFGAYILPDEMKFVESMLYGVIIPFNAIKAGANALIAGVLYLILGKRIVI